MHIDHMTLCGFSPSVVLSAAASDSASGAGSVLAASMGSSVAAGSGVASVAAGSAAFSVLVSLLA